MRWGVWNEPDGVWGAERLTEVQWWLCSSPCVPQRVQVTTGRHFGNEAQLRPWLTALTPASVMCGPYGILCVCVCVCVCVWRSEMNCMCVWTCTCVFNRVYKFRAVSSQIRNLNEHFCNKSRLLNSCSYNTPLMLTAVRVSEFQYSDEMQRRSSFPFAVKRQKSFISWSQCC